MRCRLEWEYQEHNYDIEEGDHQQEMIDELDVGWSGNIKNIIINKELNQDQVNELKKIINRHQKYSVTNLE